MTRVLAAVAVCAALAVACSNALEPSSGGSLIPSHGDATGVNGLERLERTGPFESGVEEQFRLHVDSALVSRVEWSASAGALSTSGNTASWTPPRTSSAALELTVHRRDGTTGALRWDFSIQPSVDANHPMTAQSALLATPMPVLDGGSIEVSGGACEVRYEGTTSNVAIAFTTATHPALMYGRWNGSVWTLEVVDAMGFNTGGQISQYVSMQVEASGTPHLVYVRDSQVWYATKSGGNWVRERVDSPTVPLVTANVLGSTRGLTSSPSLVLSSGAPSVLYASGIASPYRAVIAIRSAGNWSRTTVPPTAASSSSMYPMGEVIIDAAGRYLFAAEDFTGLSPYTRLFAWTSTGTSSITPTTQFDVRTEAVIVGGNRLLLRTRAGLFDTTLSTTFTSSTLAWSAAETSGSDIGDLEWNAATGRPVILHHHGSNLELVTPNAGGFWTYIQLGASSGASAGLAVHPTSGDVSVCYQSGGRIMFQ